MINENVIQIVEMIKNISEMNFDFSNYDYYKELQELTSLSWEDFHTEILDELNRIDCDRNIDYQLLWYDSLAFPPEIPKIYYKDGTPANVFYGFLPSKIHEVEGEIGGFHDANINYSSFEKGELSLYLDGRRWGLISKETYQVKLNFLNCDKVMFFESDKNDIETDFNVEMIRGKQIMSLHELPMIEYIFRSLKLDIKYMNTQKRLFHICISDDNSFYNLYIFCDKWNS